MSDFVCDGTCAGNEFGDCNHGASNDGLGPKTVSTTLARDLLSRLEWYVNTCPCPGMPCVSACSTCNKTQGLINEAHARLDAKKPVKP